MASCWTRKQAGPPLEGSVELVFDSDGALIIRNGKVAYRWNTYGSLSEAIAATKDEVSGCLPKNERALYYLDDDPPDWCIEMNKPPYNGSGWKAWLSHKRQGQRVAFPDAAN